MQNFFKSKRKEQSQREEKYGLEMLNVEEGKHAKFVRY